MSIRPLLIVFAFLIAAPTISAQSNVFVYPQKGQSAAQQAQDESECRTWAQQQQSANQAEPQGQAGPDGTRVRGAARGAAAGATIGAISGDAGKGAAIGAAGGGMAAGRRKRMARRAEQDQQAKAQQDSLNRAFAACMDARGYSVK